MSGNNIGMKISRFEEIEAWQLARELAQKVAEVYAIGNCNEPLLIADAIGTGLRTAREI
jgi:hypothetical protein